MRDNRFDVLGGGHFGTNFIAVGIADIDKPF